MPISTAREIIARVKVRLEDPTSQYWTEGDLIEAYNDALDELSDATEINETYVPIKLRKWALYTDLRGVLPTCALRITAVWNTTTQKWLDPTTPRELDQSLGRAWEKSADVCRWWFMRGLYFLGTYPVPGNDETLVRVYFSSTMPHVSATGGLSSGLDTRAPLPPDADAAIESYMLASLLGDRRETAKAMQYAQDYAEQEKMLHDFSDQRMSRDRTPKIGCRR
jgi:hypothetical protein